jgi:deoxyadenosine/deoxycytidine kinase
MIVVIEGPSAAGKTTWCRTHCRELLVESAPENLNAPDLYGDPLEVAHFWVEFNANQWQAALQMEKQQGLAVCDGDPFHLYFSWSLWKAGALASNLFDAELQLYRQAMEQCRIGFADLLIWREAPLEELRRRARSDSTRRRRRHELYLSLIPWMKIWFACREDMFPGTVLEWSEQFPIEQWRAASASSRRYDTAAFDQTIAVLNER